MSGRGSMAARRRLARLDSMEDTEPVIENPELDDQEASKLREIEEGSMRAELKHIDKKFTEKGNAYYAETVEEEVPEQTNWWSKFAICIVRVFNNDKNNPFVRKTQLQVNSEHLKEILKNTISDFPGISFNTKDITIDKPYRVLFHYRKELEDAGKALAYHSDAAQHLELLLTLVDEEFKDVIEETENLLGQGMMNYEYLWTIFKPGTTIYAPVYGQPRAFTLKSYSYSCDPPGLILNTEYIDFDGEDMGLRNNQRFVPAFAGAQTISELPAFPIEWHPEQEEAKVELVERGRRWEQLAGMNFRHYKGVALEQTGGPCGPDRYSIDGRVVVDTKTYHRFNTNFAFTVNALKSANSKKTRKAIQQYNSGDAATLDLTSKDTVRFEPLTDGQRMLASSMVRGFSFSDKRWLDFFVGNLYPVDWNRNCFEELVLPGAQKDLVKALVATHIEQRLAFDDIVKGKGKGLIMVLHGPPGVGKTLTAETVAEYTKRPLYSVSSGDLGTQSTDLDQRLSRILDMASTWKCVLLIDEADIFLEQRSLHDLERNSLVSIFLRVLEYYEGILFLTSNRVNTFDDAFKSRIHVPLKYSDLTFDSRKRIWKNFLAKFDDDVEMDEDGFDSLAEADINGRQIKNVIRTAKSLAQFHGQKLNQEKLEQVIDIQMEFEQELDLGSD